MLQKIWRGDNYESEINLRAGTFCTAAILMLVCALVTSVASAADKKGPGKGGAGAGGPVPVSVCPVERTNVPIYLDGLGTVQAFNTVTVRARVDGQLESVAFTEGQDVKKGDVLARIDPKPFQTQLAQAVAKKAQDAAQLTNALVQLKRDAELLTSKILAAADYDTQKAQAEQFDATVKADQAAIDSAQVQLDYTTIASPIDGRTGVRLVDQGNIVHATDTSGLVVIAQLKPISVVFTLPEQTVPEIQKQMANGALSVLSVNRDNRSVLGEGKLAVVDNSIDTTTGTIRLKATFPNSDLRLWPGQFVNMRLLLTVRTNALVVPESVIQRGPQGPYAFLVQPAGTNTAVKLQPVKTGPAEAGKIVIEQGLKAGDQVVVEGQYRLQNGSKVRARPAGKAADEEGET
jgi:multidrug efflux system membrane fusion protein